MNADTENCERLHDRRVQSDSEKWVETLKGILDYLQEPILRIDSRVAALYDNMASSEQAEILQWISSIDYADIHYSVRKGWTEGTGRWLLSHDQYQTWRGSGDSAILWLHGIRKQLVFYFQSIHLFFKRVRARQSSSLVSLNRLRKKLSSLRTKRLLHIFIVTAIRRIVKTLLWP